MICKNQNCIEVKPLDQERLEGKGATRVVGYGHVGDGNMHLNITTPEYSQEVMDGIEPFLYEWTSGHRLSINCK